LEAPALNETLCRALIQARLTEEDVAARLQVDPKTVRRWLEGRVPYLRHRWAIAAMVGADETDLWPQLRSTQTRPDEVVGIYPHRDAVPLEVWLHMFGSAQREIGILDDVDMPVATDPPIAAVLAERARSGAKMRICLHDTNAPTGAQGAVCPDSGNTSEVRVDEVLAIYAPLHAQGKVDIRLHRGVMYNSIYYADDQMLVSQHAYGTPVKSAPMLHLLRAEDSDMTAAYSQAFETAWATAAPVQGRFL
jgi:transcriptional regulator with XRE-family HTH domain